MGRRKWGRYGGGSWDGWGYAPSTPRQAKGGIKAKNRRGSFGESWWGRRWVEVLEGFGIGARLGRGRTYARKGQVTDIAVGPGTVSATVQGSRARPYLVTIGLATLDDDAWGQVAEGLGRRAAIPAKLLSGEMPAELEEVFRDAGLSLFPARHSDLKTQCSCPDWSNPCKHIAAVYYLLAEELDRDPFLLLRLRGTSREALLELLGRGGPSTEVASEPEPLPADPDAFWTGAGPLPDPAVTPAPAEAIAALPRTLGGFPFWRADEPFLDALVPIYRAAAAEALELLAGQASGDSGEA